MASGQAPYASMAAALQQQQQQQQTNQPNNLTSQLMNLAQGMSVQPTTSMVNVPGTSASADIPNMSMMPPHLLNMFGGLNPAALLAAQAAQYGMQFTPSPTATMSNSATPVPLPSDQSYPISRSGSGTPQQYSNDMNMQPQVQNLAQMGQQLNMPQLQQSQQAQNYRYQGNPAQKMQQNQQGRSHSRRDHAAMSNGSGNRNSNRYNDDERSGKRQRSEPSQYSNVRSSSQGVNPARDSYFASNANASTDYHANNSNSGASTPLAVADELNYATHELTSLSVGITELACWFPKLVMAQDCTRVGRSFLQSLVPSYRANKVASWTLPIEIVEGNRPLIEVLPYQPDNVAVPSARPSRFTGADHLPKRYNSKVLLVSLDPEVAKFTNTSVRNTLLSSHLRFLVNTKLENMSHQLVGGAWNAERDGAHPLEGGGTPLIRTAIRCVMEQTGINLSRVRNWTKFCVFEYHRPAEIFKGKAFEEELETTVVWLVNVQEAYCRTTFESMWRRYEVSRIKQQKAGPTGAEFASLISSTNRSGSAMSLNSGENIAGVSVLESSREEGESPATVELAADGQSVEIDLSHMPKETYIMACSMQPEKMQVRPMSLEALLDYQLSNKSEKAFELSVCAEFFRDLLCLRHGMALVHQFLAEMQSEPSHLFPSFSYGGIRNQIVSSLSSHEDFIAPIIQFDEPNFSFDEPPSTLAGVSTPSATPNAPLAFASGTEVGSGDNDTSPKFDISKLLANLSSNAASKSISKPEVTKQPLISDQDSIVEPSTTVTSSAVSKDHRSVLIATPTSNPPPSSRSSSAAPTRDASPEYRLPEPQDLLSLAKFYQAFRYFDRIRHRYLRLGDLERLMGSLNLSFSRKVIFDLLRTKSLRKMNRTYFEETINDASNIFNSHRNAQPSSTDLNNVGAPRQRYIGKREDVKLWYEDAISKALVG